MYVVGHFSGQRHDDHCKRAANLIPFPRVHIVIIGVAPLRSHGLQQYITLIVPEITQQVFDAMSTLSAAILVLAAT